LLVVRNVTLDKIFIDEVGEDALDLVFVDVEAEEGERLLQDGELDVSGLVFEEEDFLDEVAIHEDLDFLEEEESASFDESALVCIELVVEGAEVALFDGVDERRERGEAVLLE